MKHMLNFDEALIQKGRIRVLNIVSSEGEINISSLARKANMGHTAICNHVQALSELGLVKDKRDGYNRVIIPLFNKFIVRFEKKQGMTITVQ